MVRSHEQNVRRWAYSRIEPKADPPYSLSTMRRMTYQGDVLYSYGTHFPLVRLIRKRGKPSHWLLNGDTWSGGWSMTSQHQAAVLHVVESMKDSLGMEYVTVPQSVLDAAGIDDSTVQLVHRTSDWHEPRTETFNEEPPGSFWEYEQVTLPGTDGWQHRRTGEFVGRNGWERHEPPGRPALSGYWDWDEHWRQVKAWENEWETIPRVTKNTGRRTLRLSKRQSWTELEQYERIDGTVGFRYSWSRHWLGESLIKAKVWYTGRRRCRRCQGTGQVAPYSEQFADDQGYGPLTERQERWFVYDRHESYREAVEKAYISPGRHRTVAATRMTTTCAECNGARWLTVTKQRWAYFLSGFDHNEPRPSYFFTQLPPDARPTTIDEAYASLKPATVRLAEESGREVLRQGDVYAIPMPGLTLRELKKQGGVHHRWGQGLEHQLWQPDEPRSWQIPRFQRKVNEDCALFGSNHYATEVVRVGSLTYARGTLRHCPEGRAPDHVRLTLGTTWHLMVQNRTPQGRQGRRR